MSDLRMQAEDFFRRMSNKNIRKGNTGFLIFAKDGALGYVGDQTSAAEKVLSDDRSVVAGCYNFSIPSFSLRAYTDDCEVALQESILIEKVA